VAGVDRLRHAVVEVLENRSRYTGTKLLGDLAPIGVADEAAFGCNVHVPYCASDLDFIHDFQEAVFPQDPEVVGRDVEGDICLVGKFAGADRALDRD
jgi:hypothetical protein